GGAERGIADARGEAKLASPSGEQIRPQPGAPVCARRAYARNPALRSRSGPAAGRWAPAVHEARSALCRRPPSRGWRQEARRVARAPEPAPLAAPPTTSLG